MCVGGGGGGSGNGFHLYWPRKTNETMHTVDSLASASLTGGGVSTFSVTTNCVRAARPSGRARCGAGAGCSAITYQSLTTNCGNHSWETDAKTALHLAFSKQGTAFLQKRTHVLDTHDRLRVDRSGRVPREQQMLKRNLPRVMCHQVY